VIEKNNLRFLHLKGSEIAKHRNEIAKLRIEIFRDFPYLYEGDLTYEEKYLKVYEQSPDSILTLIVDGSNVVGATTALPLSHETDYVKEPFIKLGMKQDEIFYFGESILKKEYRGLGIGKKFFQFREDHAMSFNKYRITCFCAVNRPDDHAFRPKNYVALDSFWTSLGYRKEPQLTSSFSWKDIGDREESSKPMVYWAKKWK
tara:strand:+ start:76316 stop:76921 length:606 start_codon:yes stop_codon:yes gene_type:complete